MPVNNCYKKKYVKINDEYAAHLCIYVLGSSLVVDELVQDGLGSIWVPHEFGSSGVEL